MHYTLENHPELKSAAFSFYDPGLTCLSLIVGPVMGEALTRECNTTGLKHECALEQLGDTSKNVCPWVCSVHFRVRNMHVTKKPEWSQGRVNTLNSLDLYAQSVLCGSLTDGDD